MRGKDDCFIYSIHKYDISLLHSLVFHQAQPHCLPDFSHHPLFQLQISIKNQTLYYFGAGFDLLAITTVPVVVIAVPIKPEERNQVPALQETACYATHPGIGLLTTRIRRCER